MLLLGVRYAAGGASLYLGYHIQRRAEMWLSSMCTSTDYTCARTDVASRDHIDHIKKVQHVHTLD